MRAGRVRALNADAMRFGLSLLLLTLVLSSAQPCEAQSFALPLDVHQGLLLGASRPRTPYLFEARLSPGIDLGPVRFAAVVAPTYVNPRWDLALGGQVSLFAVVALRRFGVRLALEGEYLPGLKRPGHRWGSWAKRLGSCASACGPAWTSRRGE